MEGRCTCGAQLYADSLFCHRCGKPQRELIPPDPAAPEPPPLPPARPLYVPDPAMSRRFAVSDIGLGNRQAVGTALVTAVVALILLMIPLPLAPFFHVVWLLAAGFVAVYVYRRHTGEEVTLRSGARLGWLTGLFCYMFLLVLLVAGTIVISTRGGMEELARQIRAQAQPGVDVDSVLQVLQSPGEFAFAIVAVLALLFMFLTTIPMIGGAVGAKVLERE